MRYSGEHKSETRTRVLRAAAREIRARGPANVAVAGVMQRAGLTHGGFYAHFASKDALVTEAIGVIFADAREQSPPLDPDVGARAALLGYVDFYLSTAHRDARERGCPLPALSGDLAGATPAVRERFAAGAAFVTARLSSALTAIGAADPETEGSALMSQLVGAVVLARAVSGAASDAILAAARATVVARYQLETTS